VLSVLSALPAFAQPSSSTVTGIVVDASTRLPIAAATVKTETQQVVADAKGAFALTVAQGLRTIEVVAPGYFPLVTTLEVGAGGVTGAELALARDDGFASSVDVVAPAPAVAPATQTVAPIQVLRTPGALDNIYRTLQTLPGVTATEEFGPRTAPLGVRVAAIEDAADRDADGVLDELVPAIDPSGLLVYEVDLGGVDNLYRARLPVFARVDLRATWRPRGATGRWEFYAEVINLLNRKNAGAFEARLEYDPSSDRPRIVEERDQSIPRLPTVGIRFRF
jgi:hypothetical protein